MNLQKNINAGKIVLLFLCILNLLTLQAQVVKTVNIAIPGTLSTTLSDDEKNTITNLTIIGTIDARDFKTMRDSIPNLAVIDLSGVHIAAYTGSEGTILNTNTYPENQVPDNAFYKDNNPFSICPLISFIFPVSATSIGESAFFGCEQLSSVDIPTGIDSIGRSAFSSCQGLVSLNISEGVSHIGEFAFNECTNLASVSIPASMRIIGQNAFTSCYNLSALTILDGVTSIEEGAFESCSTLSSVVLPSSVTSISNNTFYGCLNLTSVIIPSSVTSIGSQAFRSCENLSVVILPASVTSIGESAFSKCGMNSFAIPASVKIIESFAFSQCWNLSSVEFPEGIISIGEFAFSNCSRLSSLTLPSSVISIGESSFIYCDNLISIVIPEGVTSIGREAFKKCIRLHSVTIPSSVTSIGMNAFDNCSGLVSIKVGYSVPLDLVDSQNAFYLVDKATCELQIPYGTKGLYAAAYQWKDFTNIIESPIVFNLSANIVTIAAGEGSNASVEITSETIWEAKSNQPWLKLNVSSGIGNGSLLITAAANPSVAARTAQITVSLNGVPTQTVSVTQETKGITMQVTPGSLSSILTDVEKSTGTKLLLTGSIDARDFRTMRDEMPNLSLIDLSNAHIVSYTGIEGTRLYDTFTYPENEIPQFAFSDWNYGGKTSLTTFVYPLSANSIGQSAFSYCNNLTEAILPSSLDSIGIDVFKFCPKLRTVTIPEGVQSIGASAFKYCPLLESVIIPSTVSSIGNNTFNSCKKLSSVILTEGVQSIGEDAFLNCINLTSAIIPSTILSIDKYAFGNCNKVNPITLSEGLASIGEGAFYGCKSLISITIPSSVTSIGAMAFQSCIALTSINAGHNVPLDLSLSPGIFNEVEKNNCILYVPYEAKSLYADANQWKDFVNSNENTMGFKLSLYNVLFSDIAGSKATIYITGNIGWTASSNQKWLTLNSDSGEAVDTLEITANDNKSDTMRTARVTLSAVYGGNHIFHTITVSQENNAYKFEVTPGGLSSKLTDDEKSNITKLTLTGTIDARDFKTLRDEMPKLAMIDLSKVQIVEYTGTKGTIIGSTLTYPENEIPTRAFNKLNSGSSILESIQLPYSATAIGDKSFERCEKLISVIIPDGVTTIGKYAFEQCTRLTSITIPSSVNLIENNTFAYCEQLNSVILSEGLTSIGNSAFYNCSRLVSVLIPSTVNSIGDMAFFSCTNLTSINIPEGVRTIGIYSFAYCNAIQLITIPSSVTSIGMGAFITYSLNSLTAFHSIPIDLKSNPSVFMDVNKTNCILYVPYGSKELYAAADQWKDFINIVEFDGPIIYPGIIVEKGTADQVIDLKSVFNDPDVLNVSVTSNTNEPVVVATINGSELRLSFSKENTGTSEIIITALSKGKEVKSIFNIEVKLRTGIYPLVDSSSILLYPNPTLGEVHVKLNSHPSTGTNLFVYDAFGKVVYKSLNTKQEETFNLYGNPPGVYFIKNNNQETSKIILQ